MDEKRTEPLGVEGLGQIADDADAKVMSDHAEVLSVKDRLLRRSRKKVYRFIIEDDEDEIPIDTRRMTSGEREQAIIHYDKIQKLQDSGTLIVINESMAALQQILNNICLDPELDFTSGEEWVTDEIVVGLTNLAITSSWEDSGAQVRSFRPNIDRADST